MNGAGIWKVEDEAIQRKMNCLPSRYHDAIRLFQALLTECYTPTTKYQGKPLVVVIDGLDEAFVANSQLKVNDWFYIYNDKDEIEDEWKSPAYIKWIFTYRALPDKNKGGFSLDGRFGLEEILSLQPLRGLTESSVRKALERFGVSEDFIRTVLKNGALA